MSGKDDITLGGIVNNISDDVARHLMELIIADAKEKGIYEFLEAHCVVLFGKDLLDLNRDEATYAAEYMYFLQRAPKQEPPSIVPFSKER